MTRSLLCSAAAMLLLIASPLSAQTPEFIPVRVVNVKEAGEAIGQLYPQQLRAQEISGFVVLELDRHGNVTQPVFFAANEPSALRAAVSYGENDKASYRNAKGDVVQWQFAGIEQIVESGLILNRQDGKFSRGTSDLRTCDAKGQRRTKRVMTSRAAFVNVRSFCAREFA